MNSNLFLRADADSGIGTGHVMRCIALAQAWIRHGGQATFFSGSLPPALCHRLQDEGIDLVRMASAPGSRADVQELSSRVDGGWVVVDGRHLGPEYASGVHRTGVRVLLWDDLGSSERIAAEAVLNQNIHASTDLYPRASGTLLLGTEYACLREEFISGSKSTGDGLLVTFGGWPPISALSMVSKALDKLGNSPPITVIGGHVNVGAELHLLREQATFLRATRDMAVPMRAASVAVSAAGSTCWELCFLGIPQVLFTLSDDQVPVARGLDAAGCAIDLGEPSASKVEELVYHLGHLFEDRAMRSEMSRRCVATVDGRGADRVVEALKELQ